MSNKLNKYDEVYSAILDLLDKAEWVLGDDVEYHSIIENISWSDMKYVLTTMFKLKCIDNQIIVSPGFIDFAYNEETIWFNVYFKVKSYDDTVKIIKSYVKRADDILGDNTYGERLLSSMISWDILVEAVRNEYHADEPFDNHVMCDNYMGFYYNAEYKQVWFFINR